MDKYWKIFLKRISEDKRLNVWHLVLLMAIMQLGIDQHETKTIRVSRSILMKKSHILTLPTYHKYFKELQAIGYITYYPSYHPKVRSYIRMQS
ncbi:MULTISPECIES: hypothetical protein [Chryseobacterium]|uniref:Uncharacterized protein n=2 Tax=Chryseobacterium TaxID=59732 RepID=A0A3D9ATJ8_9FLAO|nr:MULTISPECIES: hypothetical protein [Chryseobacterium]MDH5033879.1 hypothetical protein [Chryseobacterium cucumeris]REC44690.1 hypothetical protein DRF67_17320 [Chryseobacterium pennipullorum]ROH95446.1 hypothetical protein EGI15_03350 [Chryseobacterium cucumeris]